MVHTYTENDLLLYLYGDLNEEDRKSLERALSTDNSLRCSLEQLQAGKTALDQFELEPSPTSVEIILEYSRDTFPKFAEKV